MPIRRRKSPRQNAANRRPLSLSVESLEGRRLLATLPYGAVANDTGEFMLGTVTVTPVLMESNGTVDPSTENWTSAQIDQALANLTEGLNWWEELLATKTSAAKLDFTVDTTYARTPVPSVYEAINRISNNYDLWTKEFLVRVGYDQSSSLEQNMRAFNNSQRLKYGTDWAFTVFIVNSANDSDGMFAAGGSFSRAFGFAGGLFFIAPSTRPASTFAHETGHMFWARDEYAGSGQYSSLRGYYNTQNLNAIDGNPEPNFQQSPSIMTSGTLMQTAYDQSITSASTLAMIGWQDSDNDGIFDVLDVPLSLEGVGRYDTGTNTYKFVGKAKVQTLPNKNSSGLGNDITTNQISRIEARVNAGNWTTVAQPGKAVADLNLSIPATGTSSTKIEIRAVDAVTGITSNIFEGTLSARPDSTNQPGIQGFAWYDDNRNGQVDSGDEALAGWTVQLVDPNGNVVQTQQAVDADSLPSGQITSSAFSGVTLTAIGTEADGRVGAMADSQSSTGTKTFQPYSTAVQGYTTTWTGDRRQLRIDIANKTSFVSVDVIGSGASSYGRLELYDVTGKLLDRVTSSELSDSQVTKLSLGRTANEIAYVIVKGHMSTSIKVDNVKIGPVSSTVTDGSGKYSFPYIREGLYNVQLVAPNSNFQFTNTAAGKIPAQVAEGEAVAHVDFGADFTGSNWQNWRRPLDVNNDGAVSALDVLLVVNRINNSGTGSLSTTETPSSFIDTSGDQSVSALDVLLIVNEINARTSSGEGELSSAAVTSSSNANSTVGNATWFATPLIGTGEGTSADKNRSGDDSSSSEVVSNSNAVPAAGTESTATKTGHELILDDAVVLSRIGQDQWSLPIPCCCAACRAIDALEGND